MEASGSQQAPASSWPSGRSPFSWLISGLPALPLPHGNQLSSPAALWKESQTRDTGSSGGNPGSRNPSQVPSTSDSSTPPLMGSSLLLGHHLHRAILPEKRFFQTLVKQFSPCAVFLLALTLPSGTPLPPSPSTNFLQNSGSF